MEAILDSVLVILMVCAILLTAVWVGVVAVILGRKALESLMKYLGVNSQSQ